MDEMEVEHVIKVTLTNEILKRISEIDEKRFSQAKKKLQEKKLLCF